MRERWRPMWSISSFRIKPLPGMPANGSSRAAIEVFSSRIRSASAWMEERLRRFAFRHGETGREQTGAAREFRQVAARENAAKSLSAIHAEGFNMLDRAHPPGQAPNRPGP